MEPFVIGSLWGNLSDDNKATLVSTGTSFTLKDDLQDVRGEVSAGVNFFNPTSARTSTASAAKPACASPGRPSPLDVQLDKDRHVIRGLLPAARRGIDLARLQPICRLRREQQVVDAQALVLLPGAGLIVPEGVAVRLVVTGAERVGQAEIDERLEMRTRLWPEQGILDPGGRVVHVLRCRDDVEVSGDNHRLLVGEERFDAVSEPRHPRELVDIFFGAWRVPVRQIDIEQAKHA